LKIEIQQIEPDDEIGAQKLVDQLYQCAAL
jgi:hypothetical protein